MVFVLDSPLLLAQTPSQERKHEETLKNRSIESEEEADISYYGSMINIDLRFK